MPVRPPTEFFVGDRLRLRKVHPCGGWTWAVVRLGADIGLVCETCGRRVLLDRPTLERRVKSFLARGEPLTPDPGPSDGMPVIGEFSCDALDLHAEDLLEASQGIEVQVIYYYTSSSGQGSGRLGAGDRVRVLAAPPAGSSTALLEPIDYQAFQDQFVPGGVRGQETYTGYALDVPCMHLARAFSRIEPDDEVEGTVAEASTG
jgi:hypothetical protein